MRLAVAALKELIARCGPLNAYSRYWFCVAQAFGGRIDGTLFIYDRYQCLERAVEYRLVKANAG